MRLTKKEPNSSLSNNCFVTLLLQESTDAKVFDESVALSNMDQVFDEWTFYTPDKCAQFQKTMAELNIAHQSCYFDFVDDNDVYKCRDRKSVV